MEILNTQFSLKSHSFVNLEPYKSNDGMLVLVHSGVKCQPLFLPFKIIQIRTPTYCRRPNVQFVIGCVVAHGGSVFLVKISTHAITRANVETPCGCSGGASLSLPVTNLLAFQEQLSTIHATLMSVQKRLRIGNRGRGEGSTVHQRRELNSR